VADVTVPVEDVRDIVDYAAGWCGHCSAVTWGRMRVQRATCFSGSLYSN
jgi:hypothetical protein